MRILKRFLSFLASRMFFLTVICALLIISFYLAMNTANIWVLIDDGLSTRASVVMMDEDEAELTKYTLCRFAYEENINIYISRTSICIMPGAKQYSDTLFFLEVSSNAHCFK